MGLFSAETQRRLNEEDRHWRIQLGLRAFATFLAFPALILFAAATSETKKDYGGNDWVDAFPLAPVLLALLYNPVHILLNTHPTLHRPVHPVWPLIVDLHIWALAVPALVFSVGDGWFWYWEPVQLSVDGDIVLCNFEENWFSEPCNPMIYILGRVEIAANVFLALILIAHFTLFIYACIATHRYRLSRARARGQRRNIELHYHRDSASHAAHALPTYIPTSSTSQPTRHHQPSSSIPKSVNDNNNSNNSNNVNIITSSSSPRDGDAGQEDGAAYKSMEAGHHHRPAAPRGRGDGWERNADGAPQLNSPVSPINSGSGGGLMGDEEGPFGDHAAVKYA